MDLDYTIPGEVKITMIPYVDNILKDFGEQIVATATTPAAEHLFEIQEGTNLTKLLESQCITFCHNLEKLLFICNHARHDMQTPLG